MQHKSSKSIRAWLIVIVLVTLLPLICFAAVSLTVFAHGERDNYLSAAQETAYRVVGSVDREIDGIEHSLRILATSTALKERNYEQFYGRAIEAKTLLRADIILKDATGQQLVNTRTAWGVSLPASLQPDDRRAIETKRIVVSDLFTGLKARAPIISINVPIIESGEVKFLLIAALPTASLDSLLRSLSLPPEWTAAIVDGKDTIIARSKDEQFVGSRATKDLQANTRGISGTWVGYTAHKTPVLGAYARIASGRWRVAIGVPVAVAEAQLWKALYWLIALGGLAVALSAVCALWIGKRISEGTSQLAAAARALVRLERVDAPTTGVREIDDIGEALTHTGSVLSARESARQAAELALREETQRLEIVNRVGETLASDLDLQSIVQKVTDAGVALSGAKFGAFFYHVKDENGESLTLYTISGVPRELFSKFPMPRNTQIFGPTFRGDGVVRSADITKDPRYGQNPPYRGMPEGHLPVKSYLAIPVISGSSGVIGGLFFGHPEPDVFQLRHETLLTGIAAQAAVAVENARLFESLQNELTIRRKAEEAVRASEEQFRTLANSIPPLAWMADTSGHRFWYNTRWYEYTGQTEEEAAGLGWTAVHHPEHLRRTREHQLEAFAKGEMWSDTFPLRSKNGEYRWFLGSALPVRAEDGQVLRWVGTDTDITEQRLAQETLQTFSARLEREVEQRTRELLLTNERLKSEIDHREKAEEQLRQSQKMEAIGQLTGGVAHDFNNVLAIISGNLELLQRRFDKGEPGGIERYADGISEGVKRAAALTQRLLAFARQQPLAPRPIDPNKLVSGMSELLRRTLGEHITLETVLAGAVWNIFADANQLENAIINLAVNARDAMPNGGTLTIETANCHLDDNYTAENGSITPGQYVLVCVSDTGSGMPRHVAQRAFDPFFTTKSVGKGSGLGLSQVYGFARQTGGNVKIYSEEGQGTTIKLYLPRFRGALNPAAHTDVLYETPRGRGEVVLVVEDDERVRQVVVETLRQLDYDVVEAETPENALEIIDSLEKLDVLFTDVVMPGMNGRRLADEVRRRRPGIAILFTSGYTRNAIVHGGIIDHDVHLISKPYTNQQLARKLRAVLEEGERGRELE